MADPTSPASSAPPPAPPKPDNATLAPAQERLFPCESCGADMRFNPAESALICDHCGFRAEIDGASTRVAAIAEQDFRAALDAGLADAETEEARLLHCDNCGADVTFDENIHASECPFCATPIVTDTGTERRIKPRALLPFALEEADARAAMARWLGRLWFAPNGLQDYARKGRRMQGIYVPFWTYDADTKSRYRGERGTVYYETRTVTRNGHSEQIQVQKVSWSPASGRVARVFDDVLVLASKSLPRQHTDALAPWELAGLEPYAPDYLAGFRAEGYTVQLDEGFTRARTVMDRTILRDVKFDIGGDRQRVHNIDTAVSGVTFKHILLPIWLAAYKYRGESYRFVVNGVSGKVSGERPWSAWKIAFAVVAGLAVAAAVGYLIAQSQ